MRSTWHRSGAAGRTSTAWLCYGPGAGEVRDLLAKLKDRARQTQFPVARSADIEVMRLCWSIGHDILDRQSAAG